MTSHAARWSLLTSLSLLTCLAWGGQDPAPTRDDARLGEEVLTLLESKCLRCHGGRRRIRGGLRMTSREELLSGGDTGPAVEAGNPAASLLLEMISYSDEDHEMPPDGKLDEAQIALLTRWVERGTPFAGEAPGAEETEAEPRKLGRDDGRAGWSYAPLRRPEVPSAATVPGRTDWVTNPIDAFVLARLEEAGLEPAPPASRIELLRRTTYDLTGLPPSPAEVAAFLADESPAAFAKVVDDLLDRPQYGEKWGRHWLDLVRYAETNGYERDSNKPFIWRYRDYVIDAFNRDLPFDRFTLEQLAGDELDEVTPGSVVATGYHRLMQWDDEPGQGALQARYDTLDDLASTTAQAFLGMTIGCARCHDHKGDPITQEDYYSFVAFFHGVTDMRAGGTLSEIFTDAERAERDRIAAEREAAIDRITSERRAIEKRFLARSAELSRAAGDLPSLENLRYRFYRDTWNELPDFDTIKPEDEGELPHGYFDISLATRNNAFGFVFEGELVVPADGEYRFRVQSDDGMRLTVDGRVAVLYDGIHGIEPVREGTLQLASGRASVRLDFFQRDGGKGLRVWWSPAAGTESWPLSVEASGDVGDLAKRLEARGLEILGRESFDEWRDLGRELEAARRRPVPNKVAFAVQERPDIPQMHVHVRGNAGSPGDPVEPSFPSAVSPPPAVIPPRAEGATSSGRRRVLAEWIVSPDNPLTARVLANRLWQHHFGRGIVRSSSDFGELGERPTHPLLLDWLATEVQTRGWSLKDMHRLIMASSTYRMSSRPSARALEHDPANDLFSRFDMRRLTAEELRDSILEVAGRLSLKMGGPSFYSRMPAAALATSSRPDAVWGKSPNDHDRRSIYIMVKRSLVTPLLAAFDFADTDAACPERFVTTQPGQALTLLNSEFMQELAAAFADRLVREAGEDGAAQVRLARKLTTARSTTPAEVDSDVALLGELRDRYGLDARAALEKYCLLTLNLNEFAYLD